MSEKLHFSVSPTILGMCYSQICHQPFTAMSRDTRKHKANADQVLAARIKLHSGPRSWYTAALYCETQPGLGEMPAPSQRNTRSHKPLGILKCQKVFFHRVSGLFFFYHLHWFCERKCQLIEEIQSKQQKSNNNNLAHSEEVVWKIR